MPATSRRHLPAADYASGIREGVRVDCIAIRGWVFTYQEQKLQLTGGYFLQTPPNSNLTINNLWVGGVAHGDSVRFHASFRSGFCPRHQMRPL